MKPLELKEPTKCCSSPTLLWVVAKHHFACPCGTVKTDMKGRPITDGRKFNRFTYGRHAKV